MKYSLGRNDDGMTEFMTLVEGRQENSGKNSRFLPSQGTKVSWEIGLKGK